MGGRVKNGLFGQNRVRIPVAGKFRNFFSQIVGSNPTGGKSRQLFFIIKWEKSAQKHQDKKI
jgi:hypothetical protein